MQIAVVQHLLRGDSHEDAVALANAAADAADVGAQVVVFPTVPALADDSEGDPVAKAFEAIGEAQPQDVLCINPAVMPEGAHIAELPLLGRTALLVGDACADAAQIQKVASENPDVTIVAMGADNELQAEALAEFVLGLSDSLSGLVIVAECAGGEPGEPGHGGSAIVHLGRVVAEAMGESGETLEADIELPILQPEPREPLPPVPSLLVGRLAHHQGRKPDVEYPAEL
jgi:predicted amidohydrolase